MQRLDEIEGLYHLDPAHSALGFTVRHAGLSKVRGTFDAFHGYAVIDRDDVANSALMVSIQTAGINTMAPDRDAHLRSADFFDVATYPAITFVGVGFQILDHERVRVQGDLTIKDVTRPLELVFTYTGGATDPFGNQRIGFEASSRISRKDFGLTWNAALKTGGWLVGDEITLELDASAVKQAGHDDLGAPVDTAALADVAMAPDPELAQAELATARRSQAEAEALTRQQGDAEPVVRPRRAAPEPA